MNVGIQIEVESGNLWVVADSPEDQIEIKESLDKNGFWSTMAEIFEPYSCNGSFTPFDAGGANPFVGLTNAPCIAESMDYLDNGDSKIEGRFWYYPDYMIRCPLEELAETGSVRFYLA